MRKAEIVSKFRSHSIVPTPHRLKIAGVLLKKPQHMSAEQIIERLRAAGSSISKATVYNTLKLFSERGLVNALAVNPERVYYDSATHPHHHFYNLDTGELTDIPDSEVDVQGIPQLPEGTRQEQIDIIISIRND